MQVEPTFHEQPGLLDLVYTIDEGEQYRVGNIQVNIDGGESQTRRNVVLNYLSIRPGDVVDVREIRRSERLLQASELFLIDPARGQAPKIVVKPRENEDVAGDPAQTTIRGQTPYVTRKPECDVHVVLPAAGWQGEAR